MHHRRQAARIAVYALAAAPAAPAAHADLIAWTYSQNQGLAPTAHHSGLLASNVQLGNGLNPTHSTVSLAAIGWQGPADAQQAHHAGNYFQWSLAPEGQRSITLSSIRFTVYRDPEGPGGGFRSQGPGKGNRFALAYRNAGDQDWTTLWTGAKRAGTSTHIAQTNELEITRQADFRVLAWNASSSLGRFDLISLEQAPAIAFEGTVTSIIPIPSPTAAAPLALALAIRPRRRQ